VAERASTSVAPQPMEQWKWADSADSQRAYAALAGTLLLGTLPWVQQYNVSSVCYFCALAVCTIYIGAHKGLSSGLQYQISMKEVLLLVQRCLRL
jgi:hypothetical protein